MGVSIEVLSESIGLIRMGPDHEKFGDPYDTVATIVLKNGAWEAKGCVGNMKMGYVKQIRKLLLETGIGSLVWERWGRHKAKIAIREDGKWGPSSST